MAACLNDEIMMVGVKARADRLPSSMHSVNAKNAHGTAQTSNSLA
jgi:hypothetical protein